MPAVSAPTRAQGSAVKAPSSEAELAYLENRFFSRQYTNDPLEKRLERLELLVFASTQDGSIEQRLARLKKAVADRSAASPRDVAADKSQSDQAEQKQAPKKPESSNQYPVLNTLEWRALKKTFTAESLDQRLARLESKLFGQDSPSMPYFDRIERLKRTLGIGMTATAPSAPGTAIGPMPKARPRSQGDDNDYFSFSAPPSFESQDNLFPDLPMPAPQMGSEFAQTFNQLFREMNKQMKDMSKLQPGQTWTYDPQTGAWSNKSGKLIKPGPSGEAAPEKIPALPTLPQMPSLPFNMKPPGSEIPPYADPNSI